MATPVTEVDFHIQEGSDAAADRIVVQKRDKKPSVILLYIPVVRWQRALKKVSNKTKGTSLGNHCGKRTRLGMPLESISPGPQSTKWQCLKQCFEVPVPTIG